MPAGRFRPVANQKPVVAAPKLGPAAGGGAVLRRQTFQPENRRQQAGLHADVAAEANRLEQVHQRQVAHAQVNRLLSQGKTREAGVVARQAGIFGPVTKGFGGVLARTGQDLSQAAYYTPAGLVALGKAVGHDVKGEAKFELGLQKTSGQSQTLDIAKQVGKQTYESFAHPGRHPGYTLLNVLAAATAGAGAVSRVGAAGEALRSGEGIGAAIARPGFKGGSLLHKKAPGEINLPGGAQALEHDNPLLNVLPVVGKRARMKRVISAIEQGRELPGPKAVRQHAGAQNVIGRENRAREQVLSDIGNAPRAAVAERLAQLNPAEHTAMRVADIEGRHALRHPEETVARHAAKHEEVAAQSEARAAKVQALLDELGSKWQASTRRRAKDRIVSEQNNAVLNRETAKDLQKALPVLQEKSPRFMGALQATRKLTSQDEKVLRESGLLSGEAAYQSRAAIAHFYGRTKGVAPRGSTYFPTGPQFKAPVKGARGGPVSRTASAFGIGKPQASSYLRGTMRHRTGEGSRYGVVEQPGQAQVTRSAGVARMASVDRSYNSLLRLSTPRPSSEFDVEIRSGGITPEMRQRVASEIAHASTGDATALGRLKDLLKPLPGEKSRYVDSRYLKEFASSARGLKGAALVNKPIRFGGVYARPAYVVTNRPQNFLMRHLAQGIISKRPIHATVKTIRRELGPDVSAVLDALGGETRTEAYNPTRNVGYWERKATDFIQSRTDKNERFLAVLGRAAEKGYVSLDDLRRLATQNAKGKLLNDQVSIARRSRKDMVDFAVTPGERTLSDFIYFYPWLSRGSAWAGRFVAEHPIKSAALASTAPAGQREQLAALGAVPGWMKGYIPTGSGVINPASINTFATPAQIAQTLANPSGPQTRSFGEEFGTPFLQALTLQPRKIPQRILEQGTAPGLLLQRLGLLGKAPKTFPQQGIGPAFGPFVAGGLWPRKVDLTAVHKQAYKEMPPAEAFAAKTKDARKTILAAAKKIDPQAVPALDAELKLYASRYGAYKKAGAKDQLSRYKVDTQLLVQMGKVTPAEAKQGIAWAESVAPTEKTDGKIARQRAAIGRSYFDTKTLNYAAKKLGVTLPH